MRQPLLLLAPWAAVMLLGCGQEPADRAERLATTGATTSASTASESTALPDGNVLAPSIVPAPIMRVRPAADARTLRVLYATSPTARPVQAVVQARQESIEITVRTRRPGLAPRALDYRCARIQLPAPLAGRAVYDGATRKPYRRGRLAQTFDLRGAYPTDAQCPPLRARYR